MWELRWGKGNAWCAGILSRVALRWAFLLLPRVFLRVPGLAPAGESLLLARKSNQKALGMRGHAAELTLRRRRAVRATAASQWFHKRKVRHFALLVPVNLATSRDMAREWCAEFDLVFWSGPAKRSGPLVSSHNAKTAPQARREAADSTLVRQGFATTHEGLSWRPKTTDQSKP